MPALSKKINQLIFDGRVDEAENLLNEEIGRNPNELSLHKIKVRILLIKNEPEQALKYIDGLSGFPETDLQVAKANILLSMGRNDEALELVQKLVPSPETCEDIKLLMLLCETLEASGNVVQALRIAKKIEMIEPGSIPTPVLQRLQLRATQMTENRRSLREILDEYAVSDNIKPDAILAAHLFAKFRGKQDAFARQTRFKHGNWGYIPVEEPLTPERILCHLRGEETIGIYFLDSDSKSRLICFDVDIEKSALPSFLDGTRTEELEQAVKNTVLSLLKKAAACGWPLYPERSGKKGIHLWGFLNEPVPAREIRLVGQAIAQQIVIPPGLQLELFPKQDKISGKGYGNLVKMPLGIHLATGKRSLFLHPETLEPYPDQIAYLEQIVALSQDEFRSVLKGLALDCSQPADKGKIKTMEAKTSLPPFPTRFPDVFPEKVELLARGCHIFFQLLAKIRKCEALFENEVHVLAYLLKPIGEDGEMFFHQIMGVYPSYNPDWGIAKLRSVCPTLISCNKVRQRLFHLKEIANCNCDFQLDEKEYASPLIHAGLKPSSVQKLSFSNVFANPNFQNLPLSLEQAEKLIKNKIEKIERELNNLRSLEAIFKNSLAKAA